MPRLEYERINWENAPSTETPLNAENLNIMDNAIAALFGYLGELEQRVDNLSLQDATNMTATFGEPGEEGVDDAPLQPSGSSIGNIITGIHSRIRAFQNTNELKVYYGSAFFEPTPGSRFKMVQVGPPPNCNQFLAVIPIASSVAEIMEAADDEEEGDEPATSSETTDDFSAIMFTGVLKYPQYAQIMCHIVGPMAGEYEVHYVVLYY